MDFEALQQQILADNSARVEDRIEVNQRHLIDKILARYSAEFTIYREVIQNANDAGAQHVRFVFETTTTKENNKDSCLVTSIVLSNNGRPFSDSDWQRLRRIAEGNPDEQKIGFFGVGFYSLFSICEQPLVVSADQCLAFYWKGDQLYARAAPYESQKSVDSDVFLDAQSDSASSFSAQTDGGGQWTSIFLRLRTPTEMPDLDSFAHFIAKSLLFTENVLFISVYQSDSCSAQSTKSNAGSSTASVQDQKMALKSKQRLLFSLEKRTSPEQELADVSIKDVLGASTDSSFFRINSVGVRSVQLHLDKQYVSSTKQSSNGSNGSGGGGGLFSAFWKMTKNVLKSKSQLEQEKRIRDVGVFSLFLQMVEASLTSITSKSMLSNMERITKKRPPSAVRLQLIYRTMDEMTFANADKNHPVLDRVLPMVDGHQVHQGHIFIGFETHQSTGLAMHIAGPFIPTVERESLDFVDQTLAQWNASLLVMCARIIRCMCEAEISQLRRVWDKTADQKSSVKYQAALEEYWSRARHLVASFLVQESQPSAAVGSVLMEEFGSCARIAPQMPSNVGVVFADELRVIPEEVSAFAHGSIPTLQDSKGWASERMSHMAHSFAAQIAPETASDIAMAGPVDVVRSIDFGSLSNEQLASMFMWVSSLNVRGISSGLLSEISVPVGSGLHSNDAASARPFAALSDVGFWPSKELLDAVDFRKSAFVAGKGNSFPLMKECIDHKLFEVMIKEHGLGASMSALRALGLRSLSIQRWLQWMLDQNDFWSVEEAEELLIIAGTLFEQMQETEQATLVSFLSHHRIVPGEVVSTTQSASDSIENGFAGDVAKDASLVIQVYRPSECFVQEVRAFANVPVVSLRNPRLVDRSFLVALGVQTHVDVKIVFSRLHDLSWNHRQLLKYLQGIESQLSDEEWSTLKRAEIFPAIGKSSKERFALPSLLLESLPALKSKELQSQLPVLEWDDGVGASARGHVTQFMLRVGLKPVIPCRQLLDILADERFREDQPQLLRYFVQHFQQYYSKEYDARKVTKPFLATTFYDGNSKREPQFALPKQCFSDERVLPLNLPVLHASLRPYAHMFGVVEHPSAEQLVTVVMERSFDHGQTAKVFEYLSAVVGNFSSAQLQRMSLHPCIPIDQEESSQNIDEDVSFRWCRPVDVFFHQGRFALGSVFVILDQQAPLLVSKERRAFLHAVGVYEEPTVAHVTRRLIENASGLMKQLGSETYHELLRWIAVNSETLSRESTDLVNGLRKARCLLGQQYADDDAAAGGLLKEEDDDDSFTGQPSEIGKLKLLLVNASNVYLADDSISQQLFNPVVCPADGVLERFYSWLGSRSLSAVIEQKFQVVGVCKETLLSQQLEDLLKLRSTLVVAELLQTEAMNELSHGRSSNSQKIEGQSKTSVSEKMQSLLRNVHVKEADEIVTTRTFGKEKRTQKTTAHYSRDTIVVTSPFDFFDVALAVLSLVSQANNKVFSTNRLADALLVSTLLSQSLSDLRLKGFRVDRFMQSSTIKPVLLDADVVDEYKKPSDKRSASFAGGDGQQSRQEVSTKPVTDGRQLAVDGKRESADGQKEKSQSKLLDRGRSMLDATNDLIRKALSSTGGSKMPTSSQEELKRSLEDAVQSLRIHDRSDIDDRSENLNPPTITSDVVDDLCHVIPGEALVFVGTVMDVSVYLDVAEARSRKMELQSWMDEHEDFAICFAHILHMLCSVFSCRTDGSEMAVHMYYSRNSRTIAFNRNRALFFNLAHYEKQSPSDPYERSVLCSWFMTFCHELAHNFVGPHNAQHEFYMSAYAEKYLVPFVSIAWHMHSSL